MKPEPSSMAWSKEQVEKKPEYTQREEAVMNNLRERLDKMGLKRVGLKGQKVIGSQDSLVEGQFDPMSEEKDNYLGSWCIRSLTV